ncbi:hypothetical protein FOZ63_016203 [Perkinsus olseni]|uniref:Uncharacterized protein n=1 Tax=Perkinsus olseni TaxID=32597 RepID=A0A7J6NET6_PEROL|nr:hypothetical protein FOZ60_010592 [Perkinsus olseni]KAF4708530.1 hypothetical protein FOZ63_016203 [Perkinsus olseni]KAF4740213.1 hypothetical protein FOZ62_003435 [Perkinsus olseni]
MQRLCRVAHRRFSLLSEVAATRRGYCDKDFYELLAERRQLKKSSQQPYLKRPLGEGTLWQIVQLRELQERINVFQQRLHVLSEGEREELRELLEEREEIRQKKATAKLMDEVGQLRSEGGEAEPAGSEVVSVPRGTSQLQGGS